MNNHLLSRLRPTAIISGLIRIDILRAIAVGQVTSASVTKPDTTFLTPPDPTTGISDGD